MKPTEPPHKRSADEDTPTLSWDVPLRPSTSPLYQQPDPSAYFPSPSGPLLYAPTYASPAPTRPTRSRRGISRWWLLFVLLLGIVLGAVGAVKGPSWWGTIQASLDLKPIRAAGAAVTPLPTWTPTPTPSPAPTMTPTPILTPSPHGPTWTTLQSFTGSGSTNTASVTVPKNWQIAWQCNPASWQGDQYELTITLHTTDGKVVGTPLSTICKATNTSGADPQYQAGTFYFQIVSAADWTIQIQVLK